MDESTLLKSAKKLDQSALVTIFDTYAPDVYRYGFRLYLDPVRADSIVGDVFTQFLKNLDNDQTPSINLRVYIFQITYQRIIRRLDDDQTVIVKPIPSTTVSEDISRTIKPDEKERLLPQLLVLLNTDLNAFQRHILLLRYLEDFSIAETALIVGKSGSDVKVIQKQALAKLNRQLNTLVGDRRPRSAFGADP